MKESSNYVLESAEKVVSVMQNGCGTGKAASCSYIRMTTYITIPL